MRTLLTHLAIAAFSLHILLGCCWHHAHGAGGPPSHFHGPQAYDHLHTHAGSCHHHHHSDEQLPSREAPESPQAPHDICTDPSCVFLHAGNVTFDIAPSSTSFLTLFNDILGDRNGLATSAWDDRGKFPPHVARHIALEHFLN